MHTEEDYSSIVYDDENDSIARRRYELANAQGSKTPLLEGACGQPSHSSREVLGQTVAHSKTCFTLKSAL